MLLTKISLHHFRNFDERENEINPFLTVIIGDNARGKTNILEGIYFSVVGSGFRESKEEELLQWGQDKSIVESHWNDEDAGFMFQIYLQNHERPTEKKFYVNKAKKTANQYHDYLTRVVLFAPEHILIVSGSPDIRRDYFDRLISQVDLQYKKKLTNYEHALRKRNKVLELYRDENSLKEELKFWNEYLEEQADHITKKRQEYVDYLNRNQKIDQRLFEINYLKNEFTKARLQESFELEKRIRKTIIGPQKDDFQIYLNEEGTTENVQHYGSRSEQRLAVFWLKLNEIKYFEEMFHKKPILLLDDIFSELDIKNKKLVLDLVQKYQTVLTTTEKELLDLADMPKSVINL